MRAAIESDFVPNLLVLHYSEQWSVQNLLLVPSFCFSLNAIEKRKPLSPTARRAGWVGCYILLSAIPADAKIRIVDHSLATSPSDIRNRFEALRPLASVLPEVRGWALDVLRVARSLKRNEFSLEDIYAFESEFATLYPHNKNIRPKIRQQLQVLRDAGILQFQSRGKYQFTRMNN